MNNGLKNKHISDSKLRIVFLLSQDIESPSGLGRYFPLAKGLAALGNQVTILALHPNYQNLKQKNFYQDEVLIWYVAQMHVKKVGNIKSYFSSIELILRMIWSTIKMLFIALLLDSDIIHVGKPHPMNGFVGLLLKIILRIPLYIDCDDYESASGRFMNTFQKRVVEFSEKFLVKFATKITTNTRFMYEKICGWRLSSDDILYLPNGFDQSRFPKPDSQILASIRNKLGISERIVVGYIGSMSLTNHAVDLLLYAFSIVTAVTKKHVLILVGTGEDLKEIRNLVIKLNIQDHVIFCGRIPPGEVVYYYHISDVTIDPVIDNDVHKARFPLKIIESLACGVPVITSDVGDRNTLSKLFPAIIITKAGDPLSLAKAIIMFDELQENIHIRTDILAEFEWQALAKKLDAFYKN